MEKFTIGLVVGGIIGALCVANNYKMRALVKKGQQEVQEKIDNIMEEKLRCFHEDEETEEQPKPRKTRAKKTSE